MAATMVKAIPFEFMFPPLFSLAVAQHNARSMFSPAGWMCRHHAKPASFAIR